MLALRSSSSRTCCRPALHQACRHASPRTSARQQPCLNSPLQPTCWVPSKSSTSLATRVQRIPAMGGSSNAVLSEDDVIRVATIGDVVQVHFECKDDDGQLVESSRDAGEPLIFEIGAGEVVGNKLFKGFDEAVRGLAVGQTAVISASGGDWDKDLMFIVTRDHPEVVRMEERYRSQGGLKPGMVVQLANGSMALVVNMSDDAVQIDANNMLAGKTLTFELEVVKIDKAEDVAREEEEGEA